MHYVPDSSKWVATLGATGTEIQAAATVAAAANNVAIAASSGRRAFIRGFAVTGSAATGAITIEVTITGLPTTLRYSIAIPTAASGVVVEPLLINFPVPLAASADNTAITVNVPSFGAGNTNCSVSVYGFYV